MELPTELPKWVGDSEDDSRFSIITRVSVQDKTIIHESACALYEFQRENSRFSTHCRSWYRETSGTWSNKSSDVGVWQKGYKNVFTWSLQRKIPEGVLPCKRCIAALAWRAAIEKYFERDPFIREEITSTASLEKHMKRELISPQFHALKMLYERHFELDASRAGRITTKTFNRYVTTRDHAPSIISDFLDLGIITISATENGTNYVNFIVQNSVDTLVGLMSYYQSQFNARRSGRET